MAVGEFVDNAARGFYNTYNLGLRQRRLEQIEQNKKDVLISNRNNRIEKSAVDVGIDPAQYNPTRQDKQGYIVNAPGGINYEKMQSDVAERRRTAFDIELLKKQAEYDKIAEASDARNKMIMYLGDTSNVLTNVFGGNRDMAKAYCHALPDDELRTTFTQIASGQKVPSVILKAHSADAAYRAGIDEALSRGETYSPQLYRKIADDIRLRNKLIDEYATKATPKSLARFAKTYPTDVSLLVNKPKEPTRDQTNKEARALRKERNAELDKLVKGGNYEIGQELDPDELKDLTVKLKAKGYRPVTESISKKSWNPSKWGEPYTAEEVTLTGIELIDNNQKGNTDSDKPVRYKYDSKTKKLVPIFKIKE